MMRHKPVIPAREVMHAPRLLLAFVLLLCGPLLPSCQFAPPPGYAESAPVVLQRDSLFRELVALLPQPQQAEAEAQQEARWLADHAFKAAASIARLYDPCLPGWLNNRLVNSSFNLQERGLCWHYQHDMFRELRRRKLVYFRLGCCVRDRGKGSEHNCIFVAAREGQWPLAVVLDAWRHNGRLKVITYGEIVRRDWKEDVPWTEMMAHIYPECHSYPVEHWARVKSGTKWNAYVPSDSPQGRACRQGMLMQYNMYQGLRARNGRLTDY